MRKALIFGATGAIGSALLKRLNESALYSEIHCIGRRAPALKSHKIKVHIVSYDALAQFTLTNTIDDVFCTVGTTIKVAGSVDNFKQVDKYYVIAAGELAKRLDVCTFSVVSAIGADENSKHYYTQTKGETESLLQALNLTSLRIFRPSLLYGGREGFRLKETLGHWLLTFMKPILQGPWQKYRAIHINQVAKALEASARLKYTQVKVFESDEIQRF